MSECMECPASMCPLIAPKGSPWTGEYGAICPGHDNLDTDGCAWWGLACGGNGIQSEVEDAARRGGRGIVFGPNQPKHTTIGVEKHYECPKASVCRWQERAEKHGKSLCPPRDALSRGIDPRVCLF